MKAKRAPALLAGILLLSLGALLIGCSSDELAHILGGGGVTLVTTPKYLVAIDCCGGGNNVNVFPVNATTGVLSAQVSGAPFNMGIDSAQTIAVHPNGHWFYVADILDGTIHVLNFDTNTGTPTVVGVVPNESGRFYEPFSGGTPTHSITITPNGQFLYAGNDDAMVSAYSVNQSTGALTHIGDLNVAACSTGAIAASNSFVWVTDTCPQGSSGGPWHVMAMKIGSNGAVTNVSTATLTSVFSWLWSIAVSPDGKFVQVGDEGGDAQIYSFTVGADGSLTQVGSQVILNSSSDARDISYSPDGAHFYVGDDVDEGVHGCTQNANGSFTELGGSPFSNSSASSGDGQTVAARNGLLVFSGGDSQVVGYTRNSTTGALTFVANTDTAIGFPEAVNFVYVP